MPLDSRTVIFFLGSFVVPALLVVVNFIVRKTNHWYYTAGSDVLLSLMAFNFSSAVLYGDVSPYIRNLVMREAAVGIFVVMAIIVFIAWFWTIRVVETMIHSAIRKGQSLHLLPQLMIFLSWFLVVSFTGLEFLIFLCP
ncbi:MAG TPA: hypothetical protein VN861_10770 [Candidatus Acidoferrales bacterium]|nr:hypothetical protein [Candidatus Acidoferrales bacterium]